jgi:single-stranded DNA-specific DHH superfamily exonuclease
MFIPGVTGSPKGVTELMRETEIKIMGSNNKYRTLLDLTNEEMSRLVTEITLRRVKCNKNPESIIGNIYLLKFFNHQEDARELSALINACGRLGHAGIAIALCLGCHKAKEAAEEIYNIYKHKIVKGLNWVSANKKIEGQGYVIINAKREIEDSIIGTVTSIIASSFLYPKGTLIVGMSKRDDKKIKVSLRVSGHSEDVNVYEILVKVCRPLNIEYGGHPSAGGCTFAEESEKEFIAALEKELNIKEIRVNV